MQTEYTWPEEVREDYTQELTPGQIRVGDRLVLGVVGDVIVGHKYVTIKDTAGKQLYRGPKDAISTLHVTRSKETEESRAAYRRADLNRRLVARLESYETDWETARDACIEDINNLGFGEIRYSTYDVLLQKDARRALWTRYAGMVEHVAGITDPEHEAYGMDHVDVFDSYIELLTEALLDEHRHRPLSNSSNHMSNLQEQVMQAQRAWFISLKSNSYRL